MKEFCSFPIEKWHSSNKPFNTLTPKEIQDTENITIIRPNALGDNVMLTGILKSFKKKYPWIDINVVTKFKEVYYNNPDISGFIDIDTNLDEIENKYFMSYEFAPSKSAYASYAIILGLNEFEDFEPRIILTEAEKINSRRMLQNRIGNDKFVVLHRECAWLSKQWPKEHWEKLVERLHEFLPDYTLVSVGKEIDACIKGTYNLCGGNVRELASIIWHSSFVIAIDSGIMHMGVAMNKPVFGLFNIMSADHFLPYRWQKLALTHNGTMAGMHHKRPIPAEFEPENNVECYEQFRNLKPDIVFEHIKKNIEYINKEKFSILITTYNDSKMTSKCIESIITKTKSFSYEIIVADDKSQSNFIKELDKYGYITKLERSERNLGYTRLCNWASKKCTGKYLILLNNDTELITPDWLKQFENEFYNNSIGLIGVKLLYADNTIQHAGVAWKCGGPFHIYKHLKRNDPLVSMNVLYRSVTGACICLLKEDWNSLCGYCEEFENSAEDTDLAIRVQALLSKRVLYLASVELYHYEGKTYGLNKSFDKKNLNLLSKKWPQYMTDDY